MSSIAAAVVANPCGEQVYQRNEGIALVQKLPRAARLELIHSETVALTSAFQPLAPLPATAVLGCQSYVWVAVTDWSLYVLECSSSRNSGCGVLLELPWLWVKDLCVETIDSDQVLEPLNGRRFKASLINVVPQVDQHRLPPSLQQQVQRTANALSAGASPEAVLIAAQPLPWYKRLFGSGKGQEPANTATAAPSSGGGWPKHPPQPAAMGLHPSQQGVGQSSLHTPGSYQASDVLLQTPWMPRIEPSAIGYSGYESAWGAGAPGPVGESVEGQWSQSAMHAANQQVAYQMHMAPAALYQAPAQQLPTARYPDWGKQQLISPHQQVQQPQQNNWQQQQQQQQQQQWQTGPQAPTAGVQMGTPLSHTAAYKQYRPQAVPPAWQQSGATGAAGSHLHTTTGCSQDAPRSPSLSWAAAGRGPTCWAPPTRLPPPTPLQLRAPVLTAVQQPQPDDQWEPCSPPLEAADIVLSSYALSLITVEPRSRLACHMRRAWLTAHMRYASACSARPGVPVWYAPPPSHTAWLWPSHMPLQPVHPGCSADVLRQHVMRHLGCDSNTCSHHLLHRLFPDRSFSPSLSAASRQQVLGHKSLLLHCSNVGRSSMQAAAGSSNVDMMLMESLVQQLAAGTDSRQLTPAQVREAFQLAELRMQAGCSLWDDDDELLIKELLLSVGLCSAATARCLGAAFFSSPAVMSFITSRILAWGALCTMYGPAVEQPAPKRAVTPYVQWVLSRNRHLTDDKGHLLQGYDSPIRTPWSAALAGSRDTPHAPWESPAYDPYKTAQMGLQAAPGTPTHSHNQAGAALPQGQHGGGPVAASTPGPAWHTLWPQTPSNEAQAHASLVQQRPASLQVPPTPQTCSEQQACHTPVRPSTARRYDPLHSASRRIDELTGKTVDSTEQQYEFFLHLYNLRNWNNLEGQGQARGTHAQHLLSMLGLERGRSACIHDTYTAIQSLIRAAKRADGQGRSKPPPVQAPPTLAPSDPLSLSPLWEQPYLFSLNLDVPAVASPARPAAGTRAAAYQAGLTHQCAQLGAAGGHRQNASNGSGSSTVDGVRSRASDMEQAVTQPQRHVQGTLVGRTLQAVFTTEHYTEHKPHNEERTRAQDRWERLVGRLAASVAWRKLRLLLRWVHAMTDLSQACSANSAIWMSDKVCEVVQLQAQHQLPHTASTLGALTWRDCTCLLASLLPQVTDPTGTAHGARQPASSSDLLWWCGDAAGPPGSWLDHVTGISWALSNISLCAAAGAGRPASEPNIVVQAARQLPASLANTYCKRVLCRIVALLSHVSGEAAVHGAHHTPHDTVAGTACAIAAQAGELLLLLLESVPNAMAALHDSLDHRLLHTLRTPQVSEALNSRSSAVGLVLGPLAALQLQEAITLLADAHPGTRPATMYKPGLSQSTLTNLGSCVGRHKMPGVLT